MKRQYNIWFLFALLFAFTGCKHIETIVEKPVYIHDTTQTVKVQYDSIHIDHWHTIYQKGDTVFVTETEIKYRERVRVDTAYKYVEKPVTVSKTETVEVEKPLSWWQKTFVWIGVLCLIGIVLWLVWKFRKLIFK